MTSRTVARLVPGTQTMEGDGMDVMRAFPAGTTSYFDPFLLLDRLGPVTFAPGAAKGVPAHPHRGFEAITYLLQGEIEHRDSFGGSGMLRAGDVQWMRAGSGLIHSEMPPEDFRRRGGTLQAIQLWVNLPRADKMLKPEYRDIGAAEIPEVETSDHSTRVKVIAGEAAGKSAVLGTRVPITYLHFTLKASRSVTQRVGAGDTVLAYTLEGRGVAGRDRRPIAPNQLVVFSSDGDAVELAAGDQDLQVLILAGLPLGEPVSRYGPFVMNTPQEINDAIEAFRSGLMGTLQ